MRSLLNVVSAVCIVAVAIGAPSAAQQAAESPAVQANKYLQPKRPSFAPDYDAIVNTAFKDAFRPDVRIRAVVTPSFMREFAVGIREREGRYTIFALEPELQLWGFELLAMYRRGEIYAEDRDGKPRNAEIIEGFESSLPKSATDVHVARCEAYIGPALAGRIIKLWQTMLSDVRPTDLMGLDGVQYDLAYSGEGRTLEGYMWSPAAPSRTATLENIVYAMSRVCWWGVLLSPYFRSELAQEVEKLEEQMRK